MMEKKRHKRWRKQWMEKVEENRGSGMKKEGDGGGREGDGKKRERRVRRRSEGKNEMVMRMEVKEEEKLREEEWRKVSNEREECGGGKKGRARW